MKKIALTVVATFSLMIVFGLNVLTNDVFAGNPYISGADTWVHDWDYYESGPFPVRLHFTSNCRQCEQVVSDFNCQGPYGAATLQVVGDINIDYSHSSGGWDYYNVTIYPTSGYTSDGYFTAGGQQTYRAGAAFRIRNNHTLKVYARINGSGAYLNGGRSIYDSGSVAHGSKVWVTTNGYAEEGYSFSNWGITNSDMAKYTDQSSNTVAGFNWKSLNEDRNLDAYYNRNAFQGRAYVTGNNNVSADTGYQSGSSESRSATTECADGGCTATFYLQLKTTSGAGSTPYTIQKQVNNGGWSYYTSGTSWPATGGSNIKQVSETLKPGQKICYRITFRPYGPYANTATSTETACMEAKVSTFQGIVSVSGATSGNTGWRNSNYSQNFYVNNCSPTAGCKVTFTDAMKRTAGTMGSSPWTTNRYSNLITSSRAISTTSTGSGTFNSSQANVKTDGTYTLYPGMVLCQRLTFKPSNTVTSTANNVYVQACASALGDAQPGDPNPDTPENPNTASGDATFLNIKVKNESIGSNYQREVYAKPTDKLTYRSTYNPVLQYTYYLKPQQMRVDGGAIANNYGTVPPDGSTLAAMFNARKSPGWNNAYNVTSSGFTNGQYNQNFNFTRGSFTKQADKTNDHVVAGSEVGKSLDETAKTNVNGTVQTTPSQVKFTNNGNQNLANVITAPIARIASAMVPYNFNNSTKVTTNPNDVLYAGETKDFAFDITVGTKENTVTGGTYATVVRKAQWKLELCYNDNTTCAETSPTATQNSMGNTTIGDLNTGYNYGGTTTNKPVNVNIPDLPAGSQICARSAVYPATSGSNTNWQDAEGDHRWAYSERVCYTVGKRPSLEVWGGNIYLRGGVTTSVSAKGNLAGYNSYEIETKYDTKYVFGSWSEDGVVSSGTISGLSSGAGLGFAENGAGALWPEFRFVGADGSPASYRGTGNNTNINDRKPGGSTFVSMCNRSTETFANLPCSGIVGALGNSTATNSANDGLSSIISKYAYGGEQNVSGTVPLNDNSKIREKNIYYYYGNNETLTVTGETADGVPTVRKGTIQVVHSNKDINITGNIIYDTGYANFEEMPKLVIYAKNNVNISCGVSRIDAIVIADREVKTCSESNNINAQENSNQLLVNGTIITRKLTANRTYGAATGANSMIPAEIINYDPTLYLWGGEQGESVAGSSVNMDITYNKELAPRL